LGILHPELTLERFNFFIETNLDCCDHDQWETVIENVMQNHLMEESGIATLLPVADK
jgi:hypothetical protein